MFEKGVASGLESFGTSGVSCVFGISSRGILAVVRVPRRTLNLVLTGSDCRQLPACRRSATDKEVYFMSPADGKEGRVSGTHSYGSICGVTAMIPRFSSL